MFDIPFFHGGMCGLLEGQGGAVDKLTVLRIKWSGAFASSERSECPRVALQAARLGPLVVYVVRLWLILRL